MEICEKCGNPFPMGGWFACPDHGYPYGRQGGTVHTSERAVVWEHPGTGKISYPPANNIEMPERLKALGYERRELPTLKSIEKFEKEQGVRSEIAWHDKGTGSADYMPEHKPIDLTGIKIGVR